MAVLLVGAGAGIGRAVADAFRAQGADVAALELDPDRCAALRDAGVLAVPGDATSLADHRRAVAQTLDAYGRLDALATFVGLFDYRTPLAEITDDALADATREVFDVNVASCLYAVKAAAEPLARARGSIVLTVSTSGFYAGRGGPLYVASKFAVRGLVVQLAHELAPDVRVNGVAPGGTLDTDMRGLRALGLQGRSLGADPDREEGMVARTPLRVALRPEDHAGAYLYLASEGARGVTGVIVNSDGGMGVR